MENVIPVNFRKKYFTISQTEASLKTIHAIEEKIHNGARNIAISSTGYASSQQKFTLQLINYLNEVEPALTIGVVSYCNDKGLFREFYQNATGTLPEKRFFHHFTMIDWMFLKPEDELTTKFDLIIWNLPDISHLKQQSIQMDCLFPKLDVLSIISCRKAGDKETEFVNHVVKAYQDYGLDLSKVLNCLQTKRPKISERISQILSL